MTMTLTRADAWAVRHAEQDRLADLRAQRRLVYAVYGQDGADRAQELDFLIFQSEATIAELGDAITDWSGVCA